jgi:hypothetical protein
MQKHASFTELYLHIILMTHRHSTYQSKTALSNAASSAAILPFKMSLWH